jgi:hypothetical protein
MTDRSNKNKRENERPRDDKTIQQLGQHANISTQTVSISVYLECRKSSIHTLTRGSRLNRQETGRGKVIAVEKEILIRIHSPNPTA